VVDWANTGAMYALDKTAASKIFERYFEKRGDVINIAMLLN
jgi:hypothetical protein